MENNKEVIWWAVEIYLDMPTHKQCDLWKRMGYNEEFDWDKTGFDNAMRFFNWIVINNKKELFISLLNTNKPATPQPDTSNAADILKDWKEGLEKFIESADVDSAPIELLNLEAYIWLRGNKTGRGIGAEWSKSFFIPIIERLQENYHQINELYQGFWKENKYLTHENERLQEEIRNYEASNTDGNTI
jgi:hypothetical protein